MIYPLIGGVAKFVLNLILYLYKHEIKLNNHSFLLGINAGLGMSLAIVPYLYILKITKKTKKKLNNNSNKYIANLIKKNDPITKRDKYFFDIIFLNLFTSMITINKL